MCYFTFNLMLNNCLIVDFYFYKIQISHFTIQFIISSYMNINRYI